MKIFIFAILSFFMASAQAQTLGFQAGVHHTTAKSEPSLGDEDAEINYRIGLLGIFDMSDTFNLRTGVTYTTRHATWSDDTPFVGTDITFEFAYVDIPVLFQFQINDIFAFYVGPVVAINVDKGIEGGGDATEVEDLYILGQVGGNFMWDGIGFDVYFERGFGEFAKADATTGQPDLKDYTSIGANFVMLF